MVISSFHLYSRSSHRFILSSNKFIFLCLNLCMAKITSELYLEFKYYVNGKYQQLSSVLLRVIFLDQLTSVQIENGYQKC